MDTHRVNLEDGEAAIYQLAFYEIHPQAMQKVKEAIEAFVAYIRLNEPGTLRYDVWQEQDHPTRFAHIFIFQDEAANEAHSSSPQVKQFADVLYPECLEPVQFVDYGWVTAKGSL